MNDISVSQRMLFRIIEQHYCSNRHKATLVVKSPILTSFEILIDSFIKLYTEYRNKKNKCKDKQATMRACG